MSKSVSNLWLLHEQIAPIDCFPNPAKGHSRAGGFARLKEFAPNRERVKKHPGRKHSCSIL